MKTFEYDIVDSFNNYFKENNLKGLAYRRKQAKYQSQVADVLVDSPDFGYFAIECKSKKAEYGERINFKSAFSETDEGHQIKRTSKFADLTGRKPLLALEFRRGRGKPKNANLYEWTTVEKLYSQDSVKSFTPKDLKEYRYNVIREGSDYTLRDQK